MGPKIRVKTYQRAVVGAVLAVALGLGACGGDDDDDTSPGGTSGSLNLSGGTNDSGSSTGARTSGGADDTGVPAGAGGESIAVAGAATGGGSGSSSIGGSSPSGGNGAYLHCAAAADCKQYGGGKVCCEQGTMLFCTKPSACAGNTLP